MSEEKIHFNGRFLGVRELDNWEFVTRTNASAVAVLIPLTDNDELVFVEQFRIPVQSRVVELPAGLVGDLHDPGETITTAAQRELVEETGYRAESLQHLLTCPSSPGLCDEQISFFLATELVKVGEGGGDESEDIVVHPVPLDDASDWLADMMKQGRQVDPKVYSALFWLQRLKQGLPALPV